MIFYVHEDGGTTALLEFESLKLEKFPPKSQKATTIMDKPVKFSVMDLYPISQILDFTT